MTDAERPKRELWIAKFFRWLLDDAANLVVATILLGWLATAMVMIFFVGVASGERGERREAIKAGVARYVADQATGEVRVEYIKPTGGVR